MSLFNPRFCLLTLSSQSICFWFCFPGKITDQVPKEMRDSGKLHITWLIELVVEILAVYFPTRKRKKKKKPTQPKANLKNYYKSQL